MDDNEFGSSTGDARENDPSLPGFTKDGDRLFRSQSQHAFRFGFARRAFEEVEEDLEGSWLNVRVDGGEWQSVRDVAREGSERGGEIGIERAGSDERPSFADPVAGGIDPTSPESPEQRGK
ncbi:MAG TPA: hypothetical protein VH539_15990 [Gemmatimonadaceae bacterium]|jgi:hypothetical protein